MVLNHYSQTGNEILKELDGDIDAVCDTIGTAGTLMGIAKSFKDAGSHCKIVALEPASSPIPVSYTHLTLPTILLV